MDQDSNLLFLQRIARLQALQEATRQVHSTIDLKEVLPSILKVVTKELEVPGAVLLPAEGVEDIPPLAYGKAAQALLENPGSAPGILWLSLSAKDGTEMARLGVLKRPGQDMGIDEADFLEGLALQASVSIENARYHETRLQLARISRDLETARAIQRSLLPQSMPEIEGYAVAAKSESCYEVGGDYLDILPTPDGGFLMIVADVAGKGLSSALVGSSFRASIRAMVASGRPLAEIAGNMNDLHCGEGEETRMKYVTAVFARLDPREHVLEVANAGHPPGILLEEGGEVIHLKCTGTPLGLLPGIPYRSIQVPFPRGGSLLLYSDGLSEASRAEEEFGRDRLAGVLQEGRMSAPEDLLASIWSGVAAFEDGLGPKDDKTALVLVRTR